MRSDLFPEMYRLEATYWWHVAKRRLVLTLLQPLLRRKRSQRTLTFVDAGCGTGMMLSELSVSGKVVGLDGSLEALSYCKRRGIETVVLCDLSRPLPLSSRSVDVVTMLDVLEHLDQDTFVLAELRRILRPRGLFVVTVPAYRSLWTYWDEMLGHRRRYRRRELVSLLSHSGFKVLFASYFYSYLLPAAILFRLIKTLRGEKAHFHSDFIALPRWANDLLLWLSKMETLLVRRRPLPMGLSIACLCQKI